MPERTFTFMTWFTEAISAYAAGKATPGVSIHKRNGNNYAVLAPTQYRELMKEIEMTDVMMTYVPDVGALICFRGHYLLSSIRQLPEQRWITAPDAVNAIRAKLHEKIHPEHYRRKEQMEAGRQLDL